MGGSLFLFFDIYLLMIYLFHILIAEKEKIKTGSGVLEQC